MATKINVILNNHSVLDDVDACTISFNEGANSFSARVAFKSERFWAMCNPRDSFGELRLKVVIGGTTYEFLVEERTSAVSPDGLGFDIWGRSKQALLTDPYSEKVFDTETTSHIWQTQNATASEIVDYVISNYCPYDVTVTWSVHDFMVLEGALSVSGQSPLQVISALAEVIGAELQANADGSLEVVSYSVEAETSVRGYSDIDEITELGEQVQYPSGYNAVTVYGYDEASGLAGVSAPWMSVEVADVDRFSSGGDPSSEGSYTFGCYGFRTGSGQVVYGPGQLVYGPGPWVYSYRPGQGPVRRVSEDSIADDNIYPGREHLVDVFFYHPEDSELESYFAEGDIKLKGTVTESITEEVRLTWGIGHTSKPNLVGETLVNGDEEKPFSMTSEKYSCKVSQFSITAPDEPGSYAVMFYFEDKSAYEVYNFTVVEQEKDEETGEDINWGLCDSIVLERESSDAVYAGDDVILRWYGKYAPQSGKNFAGSSVTRRGLGGSRSYTENITFTNGTATLTYPVGGGVFKPSLSAQTPPVQLPQPKYHEGSNLLVMESWVDNPDRYIVQCSVTYHTDFVRFKTTVPESFDKEELIVWIESDECGKELSTIPISGTEEEAGPVDITVIVKDYVSDVLIAEASVWVDGVYKGKTDVNGELNVGNLEAGDHTIKMSKAGYLTSDEDDLDNDDFTVTV